MFGELPNLDEGLRSATLMADGELIYATPCTGPSSPRIYRRPCSTYVCARAGTQSDFPGVQTNAQAIN